MSDEDYLDRLEKLQLYIKGSEIFVDLFRNLPYPTWVKEVMYDDEDPERINGIKMVFINKEYEKVFKIRNVDYFLEKDSVVWGNTVAEEFRANDIEVINNKKAIQCIEHVSLRGNRISGEVRKFPLFDYENNKVTHVAGIALNWKEDT